MTMTEAIALGHKTVSEPGMSFVVPFAALGMSDVPSVGGKNASLGEMIRGLGSQGIRVPDGFATTADAYRQYVADNELGPKIRDLLAKYHSGKATLRKTGARIRGLFLAGELPFEIKQQIRVAYRDLARKAGQASPPVAVRSSATAEDLPGASFAGQLESFQNVQGEDDLIVACRRCYASLFTDRAITYREAKGFDHLQVALAIGVQLMVRSDLASAGVMFTLDTESGFPRVVTISATWGLGETVVQGTVDPDRITVFKPLLHQYRPFIEKVRGSKAQKLVYGRDGTRTELVQTSEPEREAFALSDDEILQLARWGAVVEQHFGRPMDVEWAKDGHSGEIFMVQARPETVHSAKSSTSVDVYKLQAGGHPVLEGAAIGSSIAAGRACLIKRPEDIDEFKNGSILVAEATNPDWVPIMKRAAGIVTDHGGPTSHAAIVARELCVPAVVGTVNATNIITPGEEITISCAEGSRGAVYSGSLPFACESIDLGALPEPPVAVMVNMANPGTAFDWWRLPARGVGLARMEFIISSVIKVHPMAAAHPERLPQTDAEQTAKLSASYETPAAYFVDQLALGIAKLACAFHPHAAIVRLSDFKTNEYAGLIGGSAFETTEENPMLGFRGASRYYSERYMDGFALECRALKRVREEMGFTNVIVMVPFCRSPQEADRVLEAMAQNGLKRGDAGLQVYVMCEIPSNVVLADEFAKRFDGFSIGSNDLTQLILGVDRDSAELAQLFDERDEAVKRMIADAIDGAHRGGVKVGICGQAPSTYPEFAKFLVDKRIDSISLNPDSFVKTVRSLATGVKA